MSSRSSQEVIESSQAQVERLTLILKEIPAYKSCVHSGVPERGWCYYFNQMYAGRCNFNCEGYQNKFLEKSDN